MGDVNAQQQQQPVAQAEAEAAPVVVHRARPAWDPYKSFFVAVDNFFEEFVFWVRILGFPVFAPLHLLFYIVVFVYLVIGVKRCYGRNLDIDMALESSGNEDFIELITALVVDLLLYIIGPLVAAANVLFVDVAFYFPKIVQSAPAALTFLRARSVSFFLYPQYIYFVDALYRTMFMMPEFLANVTESWAWWQGFCQLFYLLGLCIMIEITSSTCNNQLLFTVYVQQRFEAGGAANILNNSTRMVTTVATPIPTDHLP